MKCPRCGGNMSGGVCNECGFPVTRKKLCIWRIAGSRSFAGDKSGSKVDCRGDE